MTLSGDILLLPANHTHHRPLRNMPYILHEYRASIECSMGSTEELDGWQSQAVCQANVSSTGVWQRKHEQHHDQKSPPIHAAADLLATMDLWLLSILCRREAYMVPTVQTRRKTYT